LLFERSLSFQEIPEQPNSFDVHPTTGRVLTVEEGEPEPIEGSVSLALNWAAEFRLREE
jgi:hypothetical protein